MNLQQSNLFNQQMAAAGQSQGFGLQCLLGAGAGSALGMAGGFGRMEVRLSLAEEMRMDVDDYLKDWKE